MYFADDEDLREDGCAGNHYMRNNSSLKPHDCLSCVCRVYTPLEYCIVAIHNAIQRLLAIYDAGHI